MTVYVNISSNFNSNLPEINNFAYPIHDIENDEFIESFAKVNNIKAANKFIESHYDSSTFSVPIILKTLLENHLNMACKNILSKIIGSYGFR